MKRSLKLFVLLLALVIIFDTVEVSAASVKNSGINLQLANDICEWEEDVEYAQICAEIFLSNIGRDSD
ncbi:MAG: hypothetical protein IJR23_04965, partial [Lachnospiraceae bacterium]|nr:hypothetical protein [Lachnospiraceae bacterium]